MEIKANHQLCTLLNDLLHDRLLTAGHDIPKVLPGIPFDLVQSIWRYTTRQAKNRQDIQRLVNQTPAGQYMFILLSVVVGGAWLRPGQGKTMTYLITEIQSTLAELGAEPLDNNEVADLCQKMSALVDTPYDQTIMGPIGMSLWRFVQEHLRALPPSRDRNKERGQFLKRAQSLCKQIEDAPSPADHRALSSQLAEQFSRELRKSGHKQPSLVIDEFWSGYELLAPPSTT